MALSSAPTGAPIISGDRVFLTSLPGVVSVHDLKDGREIWRQSVNPDQPIVVDDGRVYVASGDTVQALQVTDHSLVWNASTGTVTAPLLVKEGWVVAASAARMLALRATDGAVVWQRETTLQNERAAIDGNMLFVPLASGILQAVDLTNGKIKWERRFGGAPAEPLVVGDRIYVGAADKQFYCVDASSGDIEWAFRVGAAIRGRPSTDGERVFYAALDNLIRAVSRGSGSQRWQRGVPFRPFAGPLVAGTTVIVAGPTAQVRMLNSATGEDAGTITFPEPLVTAPAMTMLPTGAIAVAGVTGGLSESWKLWLASPAPK